MDSNGIHCDFGLILLTGYPAAALICSNVNLTFPRMQASGPVCMVAFYTLVVMTGRLIAWTTYTCDDYASM